MATTYKVNRAEHRLGTIALRTVVVALTFGTAAIHATLGGPLFTMNAIGYTTLAIAMILPGPVGQIRWLVRLALVGFTLATIAGWLLFGARFPLAYLDKGLEVVLVIFVAFELWLFDGGPIEIALRLRRLATTVTRMLVPRA